MRKKKVASVTKFVCECGGVFLNLEAWSRHTCPAGTFPRSCRVYEVLRTPEGRELREA